MFNRDGLFGKKDDTPRSDLRSVNMTPGLGGTVPPRPPPAEVPKVDMRASEPVTKPSARVEEPTGSRLIVGPNIKLKGVEITDCDTLVVEGRVEASMDSRVVQIAENGVFSGTVSIDVAEIRGRFEGELTARKQLVIYSTGRVSGRIQYGKIRIEEGGEVAGDVSTLSAASASTRPTHPAAAATSPSAESGITPAVQEPAPRVSPSMDGVGRSAATHDEAQRNAKATGKGGIGVNTV